MNEDEAWQAIDTQRARIADLLAELTDDEWRQPSLCAGWTVRDVAAHLALREAGARTVARLLRAMAAESGVAATIATCASMNRMIHDTACVHARRPVDELVGQIRGMIGSRRSPTGLTLIDTMVHGFDIALPLGRPLDVPAEAAADVASRMWSRFPTFGWPFFPRRRLAGLRLRATDVDWGVGEGAEVTGPMAALMLLVSGRDSALAELSGDGLGVLRARRASATP